MFKASILTLIALSTIASADIIVPGGYAEVEGNWENRFPLSGTSRYQQIWEGSTFEGVTGPIELTSISFRVDGPTGFGFDGGDVTNAEIRLSTTSATENSLSNLFADNIGADETLVRDTSINALHLSSTAALTDAGTRVFDVTIEFDTSFMYDPTQGALLLDVVAGLANASRFFDGVEHENDGMSRVYSNLPTVGGSHDTGALIAQFNYTVPAPSALALLGLGGLTISRRRR